MSAIGTELADSPTKLSMWWARDCPRAAEPQVTQGSTALATHKGVFELLGPRRVTR